MNSDSAFSGMNHPGLSKATVTWVREDVADRLGLHTTEERERFFAEQKALADRLHKEYVATALAKVHGKPTGDIPKGSYCYESYITGGEENDQDLAECRQSYGKDSPEYFVLLIQKMEQRPCPYWQVTDHGTVRCNFLEEEALGLHEEDYTKAMAYFQSEEEIRQRCTGSIILADACRCCQSVLEALQSSNQSSSEAIRAP